MKKILDFFGFDEKKITSKDNSEELESQRTIIAYLLRAEGKSLRYIANRLNTSTWKVFGLIANISRQALETAKNFKDPATEKQQLYDSFKSNDAYFNRLLKSFIASDCETEVPHNAAPENNRPKAGSLPELLTKCNMDKKTFIRKVGLSELSFLKITMGDKCVSARIIDKMAKCLNTDKAAILAVVKEKEEQPRGL